VIVMRPNVRHGIGDEAVRQIRIVRMTVEGELQDSRSGQLKSIPQRLQIRSDDSQIFDDERQRPPRVAMSSIGNSGLLIA